MTPQNCLVQLLGKALRNEAIYVAPWGPLAEPCQLGCLAMDSSNKQFWNVSATQLLEYRNSYFRGKVQFKQLD